MAVAVCGDLQGGRSGCCRDQVNDREGKARKIKRSSSSCLSQERGEKRQGGWHVSSIAAAPSTTSGKSWSVLCSGWCEKSTGVTKTLRIYISNPSVLRNWFFFYISQRLWIIITIWLQIDWTWLIIYSIFQWYWMSPVYYIPFLSLWHSWSQH